MRRWIEGFETDKSLTDLQRKYVQLGPTYFNNATFGSGQIQGSYFESVGAESKFGTPAFPSNATWIIGFRAAVTSTSTSQMQIVRMISGFTTRATVWAARPEPGNTAENYLGISLGASSLFGISPTALFLSPRLPNGEWHYHEILLKLDDSEGRLEWRIDGLLAAFIEGIPTSAAGAAIDRFEFGSENVKFDDIYINDSTGDYNNSFDGEQIVEGIYPDADASPNDWSPSTGSDHYAMVDEAPSDDDTSYLANTTNDLEERFEVSKPVHGKKKVDAIVVSCVTKIASVGSRQLTLIGDSGEDQSEEKTVNHTSYDYHQMILPKDHAGNPWTEQSIAALKIGMRS